MIKMDDIFLIFIGIAALVVIPAIAYQAYRMIRRGEESKANGIPKVGITTDPISSEIQINTAKEDQNRAKPPQTQVAEEPETPATERSTDRVQAYEKPVTDIDLTNGSLSIMESMSNLCRKYGIETCTLASGDGLVVASSYPGGTRDAAYFSNLYFRENITRKGDITISPMKYKDQDLIVIIRSQRNLDSEDIEAIKSDEKRILLFWL
ncbi:hypothetical protein AZH53_02000 [Methanomicrobiaceae archaeon CYW5]|uniref:hypothetical protein n=1 Tax=Methanovulcanius yangii TaxID=1789227 RepID=UPI0029CA43A9|nr:hypothetical protein [Methanovulcanius yangii]MBT8507202.1 hypothetical protein [Methanovulcanius yangii]